LALERTRIHKKWWKRQRKKKPWWKKRDTIIDMAVRKDDRGSYDG
jgi:hypothetical protein